MSCLTYGIAHVLLFGTVWSAATGYQSRGLVGYAMPDQSWVTKDADTLNVCWSLDIRRTEIDGVVESVILGPKFGAVFKSFSDPNHDSMWDVSAINTASEEFRNIFACKT